MTEKIDDSIWHATIGLNDQHMGGSYNIHFYQGDMTKEKFKGVAKEWNNCAKMYLVK